MRRFFIEEMTETAGTARITGAEFTHLKKVLRLSVGAGVVRFKGGGRACEKPLSRRWAIITPMYA